jgi:hypothetical protein
MRAKLEVVATQQRLTQQESAIYLDALLAEDLDSLRVEFSRIASQQLGEIAGWLAVDSWLGGGDIADTHSYGGDGGSDPDRYAAFRGVAAMVQMAAELSASVVALLDGEQKYAAAALIRQLIETEYLLCAFDADLTRAATWYKSTPADIRKTFRPSMMRSLGGFSDHEYWTHCETGGHPAPQGMHLLRYGLPQDDRVVIATMWGTSRNT